MRSYFLLRCFLQITSVLLSFKMYCQFADVTHYGAKAQTGFDNTKIFQYCLDHFTEVYVPAGTYEFTNLSIKNRNVRFFGDGIQKTVLKSTQIFNKNKHTKPNIRILGDDCIVEKLTSTFKFLPDYRQNADGRNAINEDANISIGWSEAYAPFKSYMLRNVIVQDCEINGSFVQGIAVGVSEGVKILRNTVSEIRGTGIYGYYSSGLMVKDNFVSKTGDDGIYIGANGISKYSPHAVNTDVIIEKNIISNTSAKGIGLSGCNNCQIIENKINSTFVDGILVGSDHYYGHVSATNVIVSSNILKNIFGEFGEGKKHSQSAVEELHGYYAMISIIGDSPNKTGVIRVYNNDVSADMSFKEKYGFYGGYAIGFNIDFEGNKFQNGFFGIRVGNPASQSVKENGHININQNTFSNFRRNLVLIKAYNVNILNNEFGDAEFCITEENVEDITIRDNSFSFPNKFFLKQTNSPKINFNNNVFRQSK